MNIIRINHPTKTLDQFCKDENLSIEINERPPSIYSNGHVTRYYANLIDKNRTHAEVKEGRILSSVSGNGNGDDACFNDMISQISEKRIVFDSLEHEERRVIDVSHLSSIY
jgi:hypothetical protein